MTYSKRCPYFFVLFFKYFGQSICILPSRTQSLNSSEKEILSFQFVVSKKLWIFFFFWKLIYSYSYDLMLWTSVFSWKAETSSYWNALLQGRRRGINLLAQPVSQKLSGFMKPWVTFRYVWCKTKQCWFYYQMDANTA